MSFAAQPNATTQLTSMVRSPSVWTQLQSRYPSSSLCSELLAIHQGQFVVRAVVQIGETILATALAADSEIEIAEDRSKLRVLETLGLGTAEWPIPSPNSDKPNLAKTLMSKVSASRSSEMTDSVAVLPQETRQDTHPDLHRLTSIDRSPQPDLPHLSCAAEVSDRSWTDASQPMQGEGNLASIDLAETSPWGVGMEAHPVSSIAVSSHPIPEPVAPLTSGWTLEAVPTEVPPVQTEDDSNSDRQEITHTVAQSLPLPVSTTTFAASEIDSHAEPAYASPAIATAARSPKADKPAKRQTDSVVATRPVTSAPTSRQADRSEEIMKIGIEMKRLGWSTEQGREYLKRTYGKRSRPELDDAELLDFLRYLENQPSPMQTPF
ncbi:MAG: hypothetical protein MUF72_20740 [Elainella sp. Prado103]|nr:hypothetical protein [Elainella sp. Prado103]